MRLNQPQDRMPPLRAPTPTKMVVVPASVASVLVRCCSRQHRSTSGLLLRTNCMHHRVRRMHGGADDVSGLLIAALTASAHAIGRGSEGGCCTCDAVLLQPPT